MGNWKTAEERKNKERRKKKKETGTAQRDDDRASFTSLHRIMSKAETGMETTSSLLTLHLELVKEPCVVMVVGVFVKHGDGMCDDGRNIWE